MEFLSNFPPYIQIQFFRSSSLQAYRVVCRKLCNIIVLQYVDVHILYGTSNARALYLVSPKAWNIYTSFHRATVRHQISTWKIQNQTKNFEALTLKKFICLFFSSNESTLSWLLREESDQIGFSGLLAFRHTFIQQCDGAKINGLGRAQYEKW